MTTASVTPSFYADFSGLEGLKAGARNQQKDAVHEAARQFESLLTRMMLKSMREASLGQGLGDSEETSFYQDMFDQQLAVQISKGEGLGLASQLMQQLVKAGAVKGADAPNGADAATMPVTTPDTDAARATFIESIRPQATQAAARLGVAPEAVIAHAALESGWGRHLPGDDRGSSFNLFGIKATARTGATAVQAMTTEFSDGKADRMTQGFRRYDSLQAGVADYATLLASNDRYAAALNTGSDVHAFAVGLQRGGYATDPDYVQKLTTTAASVRHYLESPNQNTSLKNVANASISESGRPI
jgi:peptidoglycan hydrolase FlgJ